MPQKNLIFAIFKSQSIRQAATKIPEEPIRNYVFQSVKQPEKAIRSHNAEQNSKLKSFSWTREAADIIEKVKRARAGLKKVPSG